MSNWCEGWGKQYDHLERIVLYIYPPRSPLRYDLYFEFDIFTEKGKKQSEEFNQGTCDYEHFPIEYSEDVESNVFDDLSYDVVTRSKEVMADSQ